MRPLKYSSMSQRVRYASTTREPSSGVSMDSVVGQATLRYRGPSAENQPSLVLETLVAQVNVFELDILSKACWGPRSPPSDWSTLLGRHRQTIGSLAQRPRSHQCVAASIARAWAAHGG